MGFDGRSLDATFRCCLAPARGAANHRPGQHHLSFWLIALVYVILGLMEVEDPPAGESDAKPETAHLFLTASAETARKTRKYMQVRTQ